MTRTRTEHACHVAAAEAHRPFAPAASALEYIGLVTGRDPIKPPPPVDAQTYRTVGLDRQIARARREMGEARWAQLNAEWSE